MDEETKKEIEEIIGKMQCPNDFQCYRSGFLLVASGAFHAVWADHDDHKEKRWYQRIFDWDDDHHDDDHHDDDDDDHKKDRNGSKHSRKRYLPPVHNEAYKEE